ASAALPIWRTAHRSSTRFAPATNNGSGFDDSDEGWLPADWCRLCEHPRIDFLDLGEAFHRIVFFGYTTAGCRSQLFASGWIVNQRLNRGQQLILGAGFDDQTGRSDDFVYGAAPIGGDRLSACHRFEHAHSERLVLAGADEDIRRLDKW